MTTTDRGVITVDHSRSDMERRMKLLEMAGGDLKRAMELEVWVQTGSSITIRSVDTLKVSDFPSSPPRVVLTEMPDLPDFLNRNKVAS